MAAKASTPAEHRALEEYFLTLAKRYTREAPRARHDGECLPRMHRSPGWRLERPRIATTWSDCREDAAKEATAAAEMHKQLAGVGR